MIMKKILAFILVIVFCFSISGCGNDKDIVTEVRFTVYENSGRDMVSFYMTSDVEPFGVWNVSIPESSGFKVFHESDETNDYGTFGMGGSASYKTLILEPVTEGETTVSFALSKGDKTQEFNLKVTKDDSGMLRIKCTEVKK